MKPSACLVAVAAGLVLQLTNTPGRAQDRALVNPTVSDEFENTAGGSSALYGDESQTIRIGTAQTQTFIAGIAAVGVNGATVEVDTSTGQLGIKHSSVRYKADIAPMDGQSADVLRLRPVTFAYKGDGQHVKHYGLVAEEVAVIYPELVTCNSVGEMETVKYQELIPMLLNELQRQRQEFPARPSKPATGIGRSPSPRTRTCVPGR